MMQTYRERLLGILDAFLAGNLHNAHVSIQRWQDELIHKESDAPTLNDVTWGIILSELTDSLFYEDRKFLQDTREHLLGNLPRPQITAVYRCDYQSYFSANELAWYDHLKKMLNYIDAAPIPDLHERARHLIQSKSSWKSIAERIPEVTQIYKVEAEYAQLEEQLTRLTEQCPTSEEEGNETLHHLILREASIILRETWIGRAAVYAGYPILGGGEWGYQFAEYNFDGHLPDMTDNIHHAKEILEKLEGEKDLYFIWSFYKNQPSNTTTFSIHLL